MAWTRVEAKQWIKVLAASRPEGQVQYRIVLADDPTAHFVD